MPRIRQLRMSLWSRQTLLRRVVVVGAMVGFVAMGAAAVQLDDRHSRMIFDRMTLIGELLLDRLFADFRIAYIIGSQHGESRVRPLVAESQRLESSFIRMARIIRRSELGLGLLAAEPQRLESSLFSFITLGDEVLWQSDERLGIPSSSEPLVQGKLVGPETITYADRVHEAYLIRRMKCWERPASADMAESSGAECPPETYPVTLHVALVAEPYRLEITQFRKNMGIMIAVAMVVFGGAMYVVMRRQLRPLARMTRRVSELEAWSGQRIQGGDSDPREIRTLTERFNEFLQKLDDAGGWEKACHGRLRTVLQVAEKELAPESEINQRGFMHSLSHLLSAIPLTDFKTIPEAEKEVVHKDFMRVRGMIERKLRDLVSGDAGQSARVADVVGVATDFFARRGHDEENFMQSFMRRRHPDRSFEHHRFELRHEDAPLLARIDKSDLYELMFNLLHNAGKAAEAQVRMTIARRAERVRIVVENDGKRFPPAVRENLMLGRESTDGDGDGEGHGIGLPYVRRVARDHGGELALEDSDDLGGARAVLDLPLVDSTSGDASIHRARDEAALRTLPPSDIRT